MSDYVKEKYEKWKETQSFEPCGHTFYLCFNGGYQAVQAEALAEITELKNEILSLKNLYHQTHMEAVDCSYIEVKARALVDELVEALESCQSSHNSRDYYQQFDEQLVHEALTKAQAWRESCK